MSTEKRNKYKLLELIGKGSFGKVFRGQDITTKKPVAIKTIYLSSISVAVLRQQMNEISMLSSIRSKFVLKLHDAFIEPSQSELWIILEYMDSYSLSELIDKHCLSKSPIPENTIWRILIQILVGLETLQKYQIVHRDFKPSNILLSDSGLTAKICDFNISEYLENLSTTSVLGTPSYIAPEVWKDSRYSFACDIFSVGCILYELMTCQTAFYNDDINELKDHILKRPPSKITSPYSIELKLIINSCLAKDPFRRITISKLLKNTFLTSKAKELDLSLIDEFVDNFRLSQLTLITTSNFPRDNKSKDFHLQIINSVCHVKAKLKEVPEKAKVVISPFNAKQVLAKSADHLPPSIVNYNCKRDVKSQKTPADILQINLGPIIQGSVDRNSPISPFIKPVSTSENNSLKLPMTEIFTDQKLKMLLKMQIKIVKQVEKVYPKEVEISVSNSVKVILSRNANESSANDKKTPKCSLPKIKPVQVKTFQVQNCSIETSFIAQQNDSLQKLISPLSKILPQPKTNLKLFKKKDKKSRSKPKNPIKQTNL